MKPSRRSFLKQCGVVAFGSAALPSWALADDAEGSATHKSLPLTAGERAVLKFAGGYSLRARLAGATVLAKLRGRTPRVTRVLARVVDPGALRDALAAAPFHDLYAEENTLFFPHDGADFAVENLVADRYSERITGLRTGATIAFEHEALSYEAATERLADPFGVAGSPTLKLLHPGRSLGAAFDVVLRGLIDAADCGLAEDAAFSRLRTRVLAGSGSRATTARHVARSLAQRLATLAGALPATAVAALFRARLVRESLAVALGVAGDGIAKNFKTLRGSLGAEFSDAAIWLALALGPQIESDDADGAATNLLRSPDRFDTLRSRAALAQARTIVANASI